MTLFRFFCNSTHPQKIQHNHELKLSLSIKSKNNFIKQPPKPPYLHTLKGHEHKYYNLVLHDIKTQTQTQTQAKRISDPLYFISFRPSQLSLSFTSSC